MSKLERHMKRDPDNLLWLRNKEEPRTIFRWYRCQHNLVSGEPCGWKAIALQTIQGDVQKTIACLKCGRAVDQEAMSTAEPTKEDFPFVTLCWLKPSVAQFRKLSIPAQNYVRSGGLLMGRIRVEVTE